jgi:iron complex transport system substrate-binding protein
MEKRVTTSRYVPGREPERIVSLLASGTELVCALGLGDRLVGRSHECDTPEWVTRLPAVSRPTFDATGSSRDIDARVRELLRAGAPLYAVDDALLVALRPDVVLTQTHCEVCAVSPGDIAHGAGATLERERVVSLRAGTLEEILSGFREVSAVLGRPRKGEELVTELEARMGALAKRTRPLPRRGAVCLEWIEPVFAMGNWGPELVHLAGGTCLLGASGAHSTTTPWDDVLRADPEVLVMAPCGFGLERALAEMHRLTANPGWENLRAVRHGNVFVADGNRYFNRSGPSVFESAEVLAEMLHPEIFPPAHEGTVWKRWTGAGSGN